VPIVVVEVIEIVSNTNSNIVLDMYVVRFFDVNMLYVQFVILFNYIKNVLSCFVKRCKRENGVPSLYMYMGGTIDERNDAKKKRERERREKSMNSLSLCFFRSGVDD